MIDTESQSVRSNAKGPRGHGCETGSAVELPMAGNDPYLRLGRAFTASKNAKLIPEHSIENPVGMSAGLTNNVPNTTMKFRFADGSPFPQTRTLSNGQSVTASDWKLMPIPNEPGRSEWVPL